MQSITPTNSSNMIELPKSTSRSVEFSSLQSNVTAANAVINPNGSAAEVSTAKTISESNKVDAQALTEMLNKVNRQMEANSSSLRFKTDETSGKMVVAIYDTATEELIRQIPSEQALTTAQKLNEFMQRTASKPSDSNLSVGMLLNSQA